MRTFIFRLATPTAALALFLGMSALYSYPLHDVYENILRNYGVVAFRFPFVDTHFLLAAWECARQDVSVIPSNPCDVLHRGYDYSPLWMTLSVIPLGVAETLPVGWCLGLLFIGSLNLLPPPQRPVELVVVLAATVSTMVVFAVERANLDILVFVLALVAGLLAEYRVSIRVVGYSVAVVAALLKYYPITILIIVFRERPRIFIAVSLTLTAVLAVFWAEYHVEIVRGLPLIPRGPYNTDLFAAKNLPSLLGEVAATAAQGSLWAPIVQRLVAGGLYAVLLGLTISICCRLLGSGELRDALASLARAERIFLVIGSAVIAGCFFAGQSIGYRGVFFLLVIPGLLAIARASGPKVRKLTLGTSVVIIALMWGECFRLALYRALEYPGIPETLAGQVKFLFWFFRELAWWWTINVMLTVLVDFLQTSPVTHWLSSRWRYGVPAVG
jgi:hypothetical protein